MRKTLICILALLMLVSAVLTACGGGDSGTESKPGESTSQPESGKNPGGENSKPDTSKNPGGETKPSKKPSENSTESPACVHEAVTDAAVEATCTTDGITEGKHCAKCGEILVVQEAIPAKGHDFVDGKCTQCEMRISLGLEYSLNDDGASYSVIGIGSCSDTDLVIPPTHPDDRKPITSIGYDAFYYCHGLTSVTIPDSVTGIETQAFYGCAGLASITIGNGVTSIGSKAFYDCAELASITIGNNVTSIGKYAFSGTAYSCDESNWESGALYIGKCLIDVSVLSDSYNIKEGTVCIAEEAFYYRSGLTSVTIPDSVISIGDSAFYECKGLTSVTIGNGVTSIGESAFSDCTKLTSITIGSGVKSIGVNAFSGTAYYNDSSNWKNDWVNDVLYIGNCLIEAKKSLSGSYSIKEDTICIADQAFYQCSELTRITIPDSVTSVGEKAFSSCSKLTSINVDDGNEDYSSIDGVLFNKDQTTIVCYPKGKSGDYSIPNSVTSIGNYAFYNCSGLTSVTIPDSVTSIGSYAFSYCQALTRVTVPDSVISIGYEAFSHCSWLEFVTIGNGSIGYDAFAHCSRLEFVTIGNGVTHIGGNAFSNCLTIKRIDYNGTQAQWQAISREDGWKYESGKFTVYCTDGNISKADA